ncbi:hypothetical protein BX600DRAFT_513782 [Xylariales sp. PMI_506]|nr:hypothetical protein BX600DRAFT_513782 [Xylariales sp. PMI_506]
MLGCGTPLECDGYNGNPCTGTSDMLYYVNSTFILQDAKNSFVDTLGSTYTDMVTPDGSKSLTIFKISILEHRHYHEHWLCRVKRCCIPAANDAGYCGNSCYRPPTALVMMPAKVMPFLGRRLQQCQDALWVASLDNIRPILRVYWSKVR